MRRLLVALFGALLVVAVNLGCGPTFENSDIWVRVVSPDGSTVPANVTVNIGNKTMPITTDATIPMGELVK